MSRFNLIDEPWISVIVDETGENKLVSLHELFERAHLFTALAGDTRTQDFAVFRVILAILHTVFSRVNAKGDVYEYFDLDDQMRQIGEVEGDDYGNYKSDLEDTWANLWGSGQFPSIVQDYLALWHDRFYLFDEDYPFYQVRAEEVSVEYINKKNPSSISGKNINRLISESNNKVALFSPRFEGDGNKEILKADQIARWLITYQGYTGLADKVRFGTEAYTSSKGWLFDLGGVYVQGDNLFESLLLNLILVHPSDKVERMKMQKPCWEYSGKEVISSYFPAKIPDNLAELYTLWSRAIYIDPDIDLDEPFAFSVVKLPDIVHEDQYLEPMTLWRKNVSGPSKERCTPRKHPANQEIWRSFGLITLKEANVGEDTRPGLIQWMVNNREFPRNKIISLHSVSMMDDGNATSWLPIDEICDYLNIHEMVLTDVEENHWVPVIANTIEDTKKAVGQTYRGFIADLADIRNLRDRSRAGFIDRHVEELFYQINLPFRSWLSGIEPNENKDEKVFAWRKELKTMILNEAKKMVDQVGDRDYIGIIVKDKKTEKEAFKNISIAYNRFIYFLGKTIPI